MPSTSEWAQRVEVGEDFAELGGVRLAPRAQRAQRRGREQRLAAVPPPQSGAPVQHLRRADAVLGVHVALLPFDSAGFTNSGGLQCGRSHKISPSVNSPCLNFTL